MMCKFGEEEESCDRIVTLKVQFSICECLKGTIVFFKMSFSEMLDSCSQDLTHSVSQAVASFKSWKIKLMLFAFKINNS